MKSIVDLRSATHEGGATSSLQIHDIVSMIEPRLMATGHTVRSITAGFRGLEMHDDVLNTRVTGNQSCFHLMTYAMAVLDG
jgi:hypothetical protein